MSDEVLVLGGGLLGAALARQAAASGAQVRVCSRSPRPHAGMWERFDAATDKPLISPGARVFLALAPARRDGTDLWTVHVPRLVAAAWRAGARSVTVCGPAGSDTDPGIRAFVGGLSQLAAARTVVARVGPLYGTDDTGLWASVRTLREHGAVKLPPGLPALPWLWVDDAARAIWRMEAGDRVLRGPAPVDLDTLGALMVARFGGRWARGWWNSGIDLVRLRAQTELPDAWDDALWGQRSTVAGWIERLPGIRRRR